MARRRGRKRGKGPEVTGEIFVITAPSGTGKTTLLKPLMAADDRLRFSISFTTRPPRPGEVDGQDYFFVSPEEFQRLRDNGDLVEWVEQFGYAYGTSREWVLKMIKSGADLVFDLDPRGARALKTDFPQGTFIFILPPGLEELKRRLQGRGRLDPEELDRRLAQGRAELREAPWFDYLVVNDDLPTALSHLTAIVQAARCRTSRLWPQLAPRFLAHNS
jgi:guanylate kinase